jgi:hypothetical protein
VDPKDNRTVQQQVIRAVRHQLRGLAVLATLVIVAGGTLFLTVGFLGASDRVLWLTLSILAGLFAAWALSTWLLVRRR